MDPIIVWTLLCEMLEMKPGNSRQLFHFFCATNLLIGANIRFNEKVSLCAMGARVPPLKYDHHQCIAMSSSINYTRNRSSFVDQMLCTFD